VSANNGEALCYPPFPQVAFNNASIGPRSGLSSSG
jgi:hypothetical protein